LSGFGAQTTAPEIVSGINLRGKTAVVTGWRSGIAVFQILAFMRKNK
jgi:hypothetical protein